MFKEYKAGHCKPEDGSQLKSNLSMSQQIGLRTLTRKIAKLEVLIVEADKGNKFVAMDEDTYIQMASENISKDIVTSPSEVKESQKILSTTARSIATILGTGPKPGAAIPGAWTTVGLKPRMSPT